MTNEYDEEDYDDEEPNWVDYALAFISGAAIGYALSKLLSRGQEHYTCPNCRNIFRGKLSRCPYCGANFRW